MAVVDRIQSFRTAPPLQSPDPKLVALIVERVETWGPTRSFPWRGRRITAFQALVAEVLLTRTFAEGVAEVIEKLWVRFPTPAEMAVGPVEEIARMIAPLGLAKRAGMLMECAREVGRLGGVPRDRKQLLALPGVGEYVADAVRVFAFGERVVPVDAVIGRVLRRALGYPSYGPAYADLALWRVAQGIAAEAREPRKLVSGLLDLGAAVCLPTKPRHERCPLAAVCAYYRAERVEGNNATPQRPERAAASERPKGIQ